MFDDPELIPEDDYEPPVELSVFTLSGPEGNPLIGVEHRGLRVQMDPWQALKMGTLLIGAYTHLMEDDDGD